MSSVFDLDALTALTVSGQPVLGIGLSHRVVIEGMFGQSFERPARHMAEYLDILLPLLADGQAAASGETLSVRLSLTGTRPAAASAGTEPEPEPAR